MNLDRLVAFAAVAETASFTAAAKQLGLPKSTISREVARLEEDVGARLFHRTTRRVVATTAGRALHQRIAPLLASLRTALEHTEDDDTPTGTLRVTASADVAATVLATAVAAYAKAYPTANVEAHVTNSLVDLARDGFDCALRVAVRPLPSRDDLAARRLGAINIDLYASPAYLESAGTPTTAADLANHATIGFGASPAAPFDRAAVRCDDMFFVRASVLNGLGLGMMPTFLAEEHVQTGALVRVLPDYARTTGTLWFVTPYRTRAPARVLAFRDIVVTAASRMLG